MTPRPPEPQRRSSARDRGPRALWVHPPKTIQLAAEVGVDGVAVLNALVDGANVVMRHHVGRLQDETTPNERAMLAIWAGGAR